MSKTKPIDLPVLSRSARAFPHCTCYPPRY
jgi:hypothetical protein